MERKPLSTRLDVTTWNNLEAEANRKGLTISELARRKLEGSVEFDPHLNEFVTELVKRFDISMTDLNECLYYDFMARVDAELEVYGGTIWTYLPFFKGPEGDISHGDEQYEYLKDAYVRIYTHDRLNRLQQREAAGEKLAPECRKFLIAHRAGKAWFNSKEQEKEQSLYEKYRILGQQAKKKGLVPDYMEIPDLQVGKVYEKVVDGQITEDEFREEITNPYYFFYYRNDKYRETEDTNGKAD